MSTELARSPRAALAGQFLRFGLVGAMNFGVSFTVFTLCYGTWQVGSRLLALFEVAGIDAAGFLAGWGIASIDGAVANLCGYVFGMTNSFLWNKLWTFRHPGASQVARVGRQLRRFVLLNLTALTLSTTSIFLFVDLLAGPYRVVCPR